MRQIALAGLILALFSTQAEATLKELIHQNLKNAKESSNIANSPTEHFTGPLRLWIHVRTEAQVALGAEILETVSETSIGGKALERKPVQPVSYGPTSNELRYFKKKDAAHAQELFDTLSKLIPGLRLRDFSDEFAHVTWLQAGHYELWLSPELRSLAE